MHIQDKLRTKLDEKSLKCILMGYDEHLKANRLYHMPFKIAKISRDAMINEWLKLFPPMTQ